MGTSAVRHISFWSDLEKNVYWEFYTTESLLGLAGWVAAVYMQAPPVMDSNGIGIVIMITRATSATGNIVGLLLVLLMILPSILRLLP